MNSIKYQSKTYQACEDETVLECLIRNEAKVSYSCESGVCQSCVLKITNDSPDATAQVGLKQNQKQQNHFLSCQQKVDRDMDLVAVSSSEYSNKGKIFEQVYLSESVVNVRIKLVEKFSFKAGQFINLQREDGVTRPYSIAAIDQDNHLIDLHVRKIENGLLSTWLFDKSLLGEQVSVNGPIGDCFYQEGIEDKNILLVGTGTGLAPLYGILNDAIKSSHKGSISLLHGALDESGLYLVSELKKTSNDLEKFTYHPCVMKDCGEQYTTGNIVEIVKNLKIDVNNTVVYLCGNPEIVDTLKLNLFLNGVSMKQIYFDSFVMNKRAS